MFQDIIQHCDDRREAIKFALRAKGLKIADVASELNLSGATVSNILTGERRSRRVAEYIAMALETTIDDLFPGGYTSEEFSQ